MSFFGRLGDFFSHPIQTIRDAISDEPHPSEYVSPSEGEYQPPLGDGGYFGRSDIPEYAQSPRGDIVAWGTIDLEADQYRFYDGPITDDILRNNDIDAYVIHVVMDGEDRYFTVHQPPDEVFDLDSEIDRIFEQYAGEEG